MKRTLFICLGNICRSPMAEFIIRDLVKRTSVEEQVPCASAATSSEEIICDIGNLMYPAAETELKRHSILCGEKRAVLLRRVGYANYDCLICMEEGSLRGAERILRKDPEGKLRLLLPFAEKAEEKAEVADPWYTGGFVTCVDQITADCGGLLWTLDGAGVRPVAGGNTTCQNK